jgi:uncharacterized protein (DUF488 family)
MVQENAPRDGRGTLAGVWTLGHSTRTFDELVTLARAHAITAIADVRKIPRSRRHPHFNADALAAALPEAGLTYVPMPGLGGLRPARAHSVNTAWRNPSFRAYADYMQTAEFAAHLDDLVGHGRRERVAVMCAEALWWRCHRSLIADALVARGLGVRHILSAEPAQPHVLRPFARVQDGRVSYPGPPTLFDSDEPGRM